MLRILGLTILSSIVLAQDIVTGQEIGLGRGNNATVYELKGDLPPLRLTFSELKEFLTDLEPLQQTSLSTPPSKPTCVYQLSGPSSSISGPTISSVFDDSHSPKFANEFHLSCYHANLFHPSITMTLSQNFPRYEIRGSDRLLVESTKGRIEDFGNTYKTYLGGFFVQQIALYIFTLTAFLGAGASLSRLPSMKRLGNGFTFNVSCLISLIAFFCLLFLEVTKRIFPTIAIYKGTSSFLERYSPEISFWGIVISLIVPIFLSRARKDQN